MWQGSFVISICFYIPQLTKQFLILILNCQNNKNSENGLSHNSEYRLSHRIWAQSQNMGSLAFCSIRPSSSIHSCLRSRSHFHEIRGAFFVWRAPILSWPRIMCSQVRMLKFFRTVTRNTVNKNVWRKKDCSWLPLNKHAMKIWLSSLRIRAH